MQAIIINETRVSTAKTANKMVERGRCEVCGKPIMVAAWVARILDELGREVKTCSRNHANVLLGKAEEPDELDDVVL